MPEMFDSATGNIPADATCILLPSDGTYSKNNAAVRSKFPNATYQTYSAVGQVVAEWIDTEPGCVWPVQAAVDLWHRWKTQGCRGFYCSTSTRPQLEALLSADDHPEWFEADPTQNPHVRAGDAETQWGWFGSYDASEVPGPPPLPTPHPFKEETMQALIGENWELIIVGEAKDNGNTLVMRVPAGGGTPSVQDLTDAFKAQDPKRTYQVV